MKKFLSLRMISSLASLGLEGERSLALSQLKAYLVQMSWEEISLQKTATSESLERCLLTYWEVVFAAVLKALF